MNNFKKKILVSIIFSIIYTFCMYRNSASITFPILMASGIFLLYYMQDERKFADSLLTGYYSISIILISVSVFMTNNSEMIFISKCIVLVLYLLLAIDLYWKNQDRNDSKIFYLLRFIILESIYLATNLFDEYGKYKKEISEDETNKSIFNENTKKVIKGLLIAIPVLLIIIPLMMSADVVFSNMLQDIFNIDELIIRVIEHFDVVIMLIIALFITFGFTMVIENKKEVNLTEKKTDDSLTGITLSAIIAAVYMMFSFIQIRGIIFTDIALPENYTYAEYAREGFFQLFFLAVINMIIVLICKNKYENNKILNKILYVLCGCTYIMIFSSSYKMCMYIAAYKLTFLRLMVLWTLFVMTFIMVAVIKYVHKKDFSLIKTGFVIASFFYIIIAFVKPDYIIAEYNTKSVDIDWWYLRELSCDAVPALADEYPDEMVEYRFTHKVKSEYEEMTLRKFNLSVYLAGEALDIK